jgi:hypothetical protein
MSNVVVGVALIEIFTVIVFSWAIISMLKQPSWAYQNAGRSKGLWVVLLFGGLLVPVVGLVLCVWYLFMINPGVRAQAHLEQGVGFPGGSPQY